MDDLQALHVLDRATSGIAATFENRKGDEILMGLKAGTVDPDSLGDRPYEQRALESWRTADTAQYLKKYSGMSFDEVQNVNPHEEENPMHAATAYNEVMKMLSNDEQIKTATTAARMQRGMQEYQVFDAKRNQINRYITSGEHDMAGEMAADVISSSFLPQKAKYDPKTKTINIFSKTISPDDMGSDLRFQESIPISEIGKKINDIDGKKFSTAKAMMAQATTQANRESPLKQYYNAETGKSIYARSIVDVDDMSKSYLEAYDSKGKPVPIPNEGALVGMGYEPIAGAKETQKMREGEAKIGKTVAQTGEAEAKAFKAKQEGLYAARDKPGKGKDGWKEKDTIAYNQGKMKYFDKKEKEERQRLEDSGKDPNKVNWDAWRKSNGELYDQESGFDFSRQEGAPAPKTDKVKSEQKPVPKNAGLVAATPKEDKKKVSNTSSGLKAGTKKEEEKTPKSITEGVPYSKIKNAKVDKDGVIWASVDGVQRRLLSKGSIWTGVVPPKKLTGGYDNPEYKDYLMLLDKLGLKKPDSK